MSCGGFCLKKPDACSDCRTATLTAHDGFYSAGVPYSSASMGGMFAPPVAHPIGHTEKPMGAIPGGWTTAEWATLTADQKSAVLAGDAQSQQQIREAIQAGARSAVDLLIAAIKTSEAAADRAGATEIEQIRARNALELAKVQANTQIELAKLQNRTVLTPVQPLGLTSTPTTTTPTPTTPPPTESSGMGSGLAMFAVGVGLYLALK